MGIDDRQRQMDEVRRAALRGARTVTKMRQAIADSADHAVAQWSKAVTGGRGMPGKLEAWAFRVGANAAKVNAARMPPGGMAPDGQVSWAISLPEDEEVSLARIAEIGRARQILRAQLKLHRRKLVGRQFEVACRLCRSGMTLHRAAKELGMDRTSLRRSFHAALRRLKAR